MLNVITGIKFFINNAFMPNIDKSKRIRCCVWREYTNKRISTKSWFLLTGSDRSRRSIWRPRLQRGDLITPLTQAFLARVCHSFAGWERLPAKTK